jgi:hypothetical protein
VLLLNSRASSSSTILWSGAMVMKRDSRAITTAASWRWLSRRATAANSIGTAMAWRAKRAEAEVALPCPLCLSCRRVLLCQAVRLCLSPQPGTRRSSNGITRRAWRQ